MELPESKLDEELRALKLERDYAMTIIQRPHVQNILSGLEKKQSAENTLKTNLAKLGKLRAEIARLSVELDMKTEELGEQANGKIAPKPKQLLTEIIKLVLA